MANERQKSVYLDYIYPRSLQSAEKSQQSIPCIPDVKQLIERYDRIFSLLPSLRQLKWLCRRHRHSVIGYRLSLAVTDGWRTRKSSDLYHSGSGMRNHRSRTIIVNRTERQHLGMLGMKRWMSRRDSAKLETNVDDCRICRYVSAAS